MPTMDEFALHHALAAAINRMLVQPEFLLAPFERATVVDLRERIRDPEISQRQVDNAVISTIMRCAKHQTWDGNVEPFRNLLERQTELVGAGKPLVFPACLTEYNDDIARQVFRRIVVSDQSSLIITFKNGWMLTQES